MDKTMACCSSRCEQLHGPLVDSELSVKIPEKETSPGSGKLIDPVVEPLALEENERPTS